MKRIIKKLFTSQRGVKSEPLPEAVISESKLVQRIRKLESDESSADNVHFAAQAVQDNPNIVHRAVHHAVHGNFSLIPREPDPELTRIKSIPVNVAPYLRHAHA